MNKTILLSILLFISALTISAQHEGTGKMTLPQLGLKNVGIETILGDIDSFIGNKPNGLQYPVTKIVFSELEGLMCYEIVAIDNSWTHLFKFGEVPYGYMIQHNRLFLVVGEGYHDINLNSIFYLTDQTKSFSKMNLPPTGLGKNPTWFFEFKDEQSYLISAVDLEALD